MIIGIIVLLAIAMIVYGAMELLPWIIVGVVAYKLISLYIERKYPKKGDNDK